MNTLSDNAIRVLTEIHKRGLTVLWEHRIAHPVYGTGGGAKSEDMSEYDWGVLQNELERVVEKRERVESNQYTVIHRKYVQGGLLFETKTNRLQNGREYPSEIFQVINTNALDGVISENIEIETEFEEIRFRAWESDYLVKTDITESADADEIDGLLYRYSLTNHGLKIVTDIHRKGVIR